MRRKYVTLAAAVVVATATAIYSSGFTALLVTIAALLAMITVHELGHLMAARACGVGASEFAVGFGPKIASKTTKTMVWSWRAIPLGGFVRIKGMEDNEPGSSGIDTIPGKSFQEVGPVKKTIIAAAGPVANFLLAAVLIFGVILPIGAPGEESIGVVNVYEGSAAEAAGLVDGDRIVSIDGVQVNSFTDIRNTIADSDGTVQLVLDREDIVLDVALTEGSLGVSSVVDRDPWNPVQAAGFSAELTGQMGTTAIQGIASIGSVVAEIPKQFANTADDPNERFLSPIAISQVGSTINDQLGLSGLILLAAQVSVFLGLFNLMPLPPLDGGHILVTWVNAASKKVGRREVPAAVVQRVGLTVAAAVLLLGVATILLDIIRPVVL